CTATTASSLGGAAAAAAEGDGALGGLAVGGRGGGRGHSLDGRATALVAFERQLGHEEGGDRAERQQYRAGEEDLVERRGEAQARGVEQRGERLGAARAERGHALVDLGER